METKEQLRKEFGEWIVKEMEAHKRRDVLLPSVEGKLPSYNITDLLDKSKDILDALEDMKTAIAKQQEVIEKLSQLR